MTIGWEGMANLGACIQNISNLNGNFQKTFLQLETSVSARGEKTTFPFGNKMKYMNHTDNISVNLVNRDCNILIAFFVHGAESVINKRHFRTNIFSPDRGHRCIESYSIVYYLYLSVIVP